MREITCNFRYLNAIVTQMLVQIKFLALFICIVAQADNEHTYCTYPIRGHVWAQADQCYTHVKKLVTVSM